jgi:hypothetical protein
MDFRETDLYRDVSESCVWFKCSIKLTTRELRIEDKIYNEDTFAHRPTQQYFLFRQFFVQRIFFYITPRRKPERWPAKLVWSNNFCPPFFLRRVYFREYFYNFNKFLFCSKWKLNRLFLLTEIDFGSPMSMNKLYLNNLLWYYISSTSN